MSITASFFDHVKYPAQEFINRDKDFINNGVLNPTSDFGLTYLGDMNININVAGTAWVNGIRIGYDANPNLTLTFATADVTNPRIDLIEIGTTGIGQQGAGVIKVVKGVPQATPLQPQPDSGFIALYAVNVSAGATSISATDITDLRSGISIAGATNTPLSSSVPGTQTCNTTGSAGISTNAARADHVHPMANITPSDIGAVAQTEFNVHLDDSTYQVAGGTATALIVSMQTLVNGYAKTFIASANNGGAATTINGISLYKPGTTTAPNLIEGKAYTVWYNSTGDCFFIKASATGNTVSAHVLAGDTYSTDADTDQVGTMTNNGAETVAAKVISLINPMTNGNFSNGTTGWTTSGTTITTSSNVATVTATGTTSIEHFSEYDNAITPVAGHKYYVCATATGVSGNAQIRAYNLQLSGNSWDAVSSSAVTSKSLVSCILITTSVCTTPNLMIRLYALDASGNTVYTQAGENSKFQQVCVFDLTAGYGSGKEPTQAQMDAAINALGGGFVGVTFVNAMANGAYLTNGTSGSPEILFNTVNIVSSNIKAGASIAGVAGKASVVDTSDATVTAAQILSGQTAYVNGSKVAGAMPQVGYANNPSSCGLWSNGDLAVYLATTGYYVAGAGNSEVRVPVAQMQAAEPTLTAANILSGISIFGVSGTASIASLGGTQYASGYAVNTLTSLSRGIIFNTSFVPRIVLVVCDNGDMYIASSLNGNKVGMSIKNQGTYNTYDSGAGHILGTTSQIGFNGYSAEQNTNGTWYAWS